MYHTADAKSSDNTNWVPGGFMLLVNGKDKLSQCLNPLFFLLLAARILCCRLALSTVMW